MSKADRVKDVRISVISKEEFAKLFLDPDVTFEELKELVREEFGLDVPSTVEDATHLLEVVYGKYRELLDKYQLGDIKIYGGPKQKATVKDAIIQIIMMDKEISYDDLMDKVIEKFPEKYKLKKPRARVRNTLRDLKLINVIKQKENLIIWTG